MGMMMMMVMVMGYLENNIFILTIQNIFLFCILKYFPRSMLFFIFKILLKNILTDIKCFFQNTCCLLLSLLTDDTFLYLPAPHNICVCLIFIPYVLYKVSRYQGATVITAFLQIHWRSWPIKHAPPHMCYHAQISRSGELQKLGSTRAPPPWCRRVTGP